MVGSGAEFQDDHLADQRNGLAGHPPQRMSAGGTAFQPMVVISSRFGASRQRKAKKRATDSLLSDHQTVRALLKKEARLRAGSAPLSTHSVAARTPSATGPLRSKFSS